ncbi:hypothetical protein BH11PLA1_BH11PLA1_22320 [soil metagenome]
MEDTMKKLFGGRLFPVAVVALAGLAANMPTALLFAQPSETAMAPERPLMVGPSVREAAGLDDAALTRAADALWGAAKEGDWEKLLAGLNGVPAGDAVGNELKGDLERLRMAIAKRESVRAARTAKANTDLDAALAGEKTPAKASDALKEAIELHELAPDPAAKSAVLKSARVQRAIEQGAEAAKAMEAEGKWLWAAELYGRLNLLLDIDGRYKADARRMGDRLSMLRLYAPQRLWELRNERREAERARDATLGALPRYNAVGEGFEAKLRGVTPQIVLGAVSAAAGRHVERVSMRTMVIGGLQAVRTMVTTPDLRTAWAGLENAASRETMTKWLDERIAELREGKGEMGTPALRDIVGGMLDASDATVKVAIPALMHEFGNGAFDQLDEFSQVIWPDELARFKRMTDASFPGVGIQIQMDEETQMIKVVMPLDGSPAQKAGVQPGDYIKAINDDSALGMSTDQAIEQITGPTGSKVHLTMERDGKDIGFDLTRGSIPIYSVKGWKRAGSGDNAWDYYIDEEAKIAYLRLSGFTPTTTRDLHKALAQFKGKPLNGLIMDLRFNPGGLLTEAVGVSNTFVSSGEIVYTMTADRVRVETHTADPDKVKLTGVPIVVLVNEGSASASEIVSGALKHYADVGDLNLLVLGNRSFGKGSVQNVIGLDRNTSMMKLTTQYYYLPNGQLIHRREHATKWGVDPHLKVEMIPTQVSDALLLRSDADLPKDARPVQRKAKDDDETMYKLDPANFPPNPDRLLTEGIDLQLETAVFLLRARALSAQPQLAGGDGVKVGEKAPG